MLIKPSKVAAVLVQRNNWEVRSTTKINVALFTVIDALPGRGDTKGVTAMQCAQRQGPAARFAYFMCEDMLKNFTATLEKNMSSSQLHAQQVKPPDVIQQFTEIQDRNKALFTTKPVSTEKVDVQGGQSALLNYTGTLESELSQQGNAAGTDPTSEYPGPGRQPNYCLCGSPLGYWHFQKSSTTANTWTLDQSGSEGQPDMTSMLADIKGQQGSAKGDILQTSLKKLKNAQTGTCLDKETFELENKHSRSGIASILSRTAFNSHVSNQGKTKAEEERYHDLYSEDFDPEIYLPHLSACISWPDGRCYQKVVCTRRASGHAYNLGTWPKTVTLTLAWDTCKTSTQIFYTIVKPAKDTNRAGQQSIQQVNSEICKGNKRVKFVQTNHVNNFQLYILFFTNSGSYLLITLSTCICNFSL